MRRPRLRQSWGRALIRQRAAGPLQREADQEKINRDSELGLSPEQNLGIAERRETYILALSRRKVGQKQHANAGRAVGLGS